VRAHLANTGLIRALWNDSENSVRKTSRSICVLVARQVVRKRQLDGTGPDELYVSWTPSNRLSNRLSSEDATTPFKETLAILLDERNDSLPAEDWATRFSEEILQILQYDP